MVAFQYCGRDEYQPVSHAGTMTVHAWKDKKLCTVTGVVVRTNS